MPDRYVLLRQTLGDDLTPHGDDYHGRWVHMHLVYRDGRLTLQQQRAPLSAADGRYLPLTGPLDWCLDAARAMKEYNHV